MDTPVKESTCGYHNQQSYNEIDLFELCKRLWAQKSIILAITVAVTLVAVAIAFLLPPVWQAEARIYQGSQADLSQLHSLKQILPPQNDPRAATNISDMTPEQAFNLYYRYLSSPSILRSVFHESGLSEQALGEVNMSKGFDNKAAAALAKALDRFKKDLSIESSNEKIYGSNFITIKYNSRNQKFSADLIKNYLLPVTSTKALAEIKANIANVIEQEKTLILRQIADIESNFIENITSEKIKIAHAWEQAESSGIDTFSAPSITVINDSNRFIVGSDILSKQLEQAKMQLKKYRFLSRPVSGDEALPLLPRVSTFYVKLEDLNRYAVTVDKVNLVIIDEPAMVPAVPIKPQRAIMIALGVFIGAAVGVFVALTLIAIGQRKG